MLLEAVVQIGKALQLIGADRGCRDLGPELDDPGEVIHAQGGHGFCLQLPKLGLALHLTASERGDACVTLVEQLICQRLAVGGIGAHEGLTLKADVLQITLDLRLAADVGVLEVYIGTGLVDEVDGLIRQKAVGDVAFAQKYRLAAHLVADGHTMVVLIVVGDAAQDLHAVLDGGLVDRDGLEAALEGGVLFDMLAVFGEGSGADNLDLAPRKGGLEDVGGVHAALGIPRADDVVHLVDDKDHIPLLADFLDEALHAAFKLAAKLRACHQRREVEQEDLLIPELYRHIAVCDTLGKALGNGGLADAGLADEAGIILLAAVEDLDNALKLLFPADHAVKLALPGALRQVDAVAVQELALAVILRRGLIGAVWAVLGRRWGVVRVVVSAEETVEKREGRGLTVVIAAAVRVVHGCEILHAAQGVHHLSRETLQILVRQAHLVDDIVHGLDVQLTRAFEAQTLVFGLAGFYFCDKDHRDILAAAGADCRPHGVPPG